MKRVVRYGLILFGLALLTGGIILAVVSHNPAIIKPLIERWVQANYQRTIRMDGEIRLTWYPHVDVTLNHVSLSEYQREDLFASIEQLNLTIHAFPVFSNRLSVGHVHVTGLTARLVRDLNGAFNIADLLKNDDESFIEAIQINRVEIKNSRVSFQDESTQQFYDLDGIHLTLLQFETGSIQQIQMHSRFSASEMQGAQSNAIVQPIAVQLDSESIVFGKEGTKTGPVLLSVQSSHEPFDATSEENFSIRLSIADFGWTDVRLNSQHIHMTLAMQQAANVIQASLDTTLGFKLDDKSGTLSDVHLAVDFFHPDYTSKSVHANVNGQISLNWPSSLVTLNMRGKIDDRDINVTGRLQGFTRQTHTFGLEIDALDITAFIPARTTGYDEEATTFSNISLFDDTALNGSIQIGHLTVGDIQLSEIRLAIGQPEY